MTETDQDRPEFLDSSSSAPGSGSPFLWEFAPAGHVQTIRFQVDVSYFRKFFTNFSIVSSLGFFSTFKLTNFSVLFSLLSRIILTSRNFTIFFRIDKNGKNGKLEMWKIFCSIRICFISQVVLLAFKLTAVYHYT